MDTWLFAHYHSGKLWWRIGWGILVLLIIIHLPFYRASDDKDFLESSLKNPKIMIPDEFPSEIQF